MLSDYVSRLKVPLFTCLLFSVWITFLQLFYQPKRPIWPALGSYFKVGGVPLYLSQMVTDLVKIKPLGLIATLLVMVS